MTPPNIRNSVAYAAMCVAFIAFFVYAGGVGWHSISWLNDGVRWRLFDWANNTVETYAIVVMYAAAVVAVIADHLSRRRGSE